MNHPASVCVLGYVAQHSASKERPLAAKRVFLFVFSGFFWLLSSTGYHTCFFQEPLTAQIYAWARQRRTMRGGKIHEERHLRREGDTRDLINRSIILPWSALTTQTWPTFPNLHCLSSSLTHILAFPGLTWATAVFLFAFVLSFSLYAFIYRSLRICLSFNLHEKQAVISVHNVCVASSLSWLQSSDGTLARLPDAFNARLWMRARPRLSRNV